MPLKSIVEYYQEITYDYNKEPYDYPKRNLTEDIFTPTIFMSLTIVILIFWNILRYVLGFFHFKKTIKSRKELKEQSAILQDLTKDLETRAYVIKDREPNAFNAFGKDCYVTSTLNDMLTEREKTAIFLHEYGHYHKNHILKSFGLEMTVSILAVVTLQSIITLGLGLFVPMLSNIVSQRIADFFSNLYSRVQEYDADDFVKGYGYSKELSSALRKIEKWVRVRLCDGIKRKDCDSIIEQLHSNGTHPSYKSRIEKLLSIEPIKNFILATALSDFSREKIFEKIKLKIADYSNIIKKV